MAEKKISQLTAKGATVADTDLLVVSESAGGGTYVTKSVTGANVKALVTDANLTTTDITTNDVSTSKHGFAPKAPNDATKYLDGTGAWSTPAGGGGGITVGTTAVTSGTDGRVFFQASGVVQQDSALFWDNTNKRLGVGASPASTVRLDVRAQGALSTDIALRVRNSADTADLANLNGIGDIAIGLSATGVTASNFPFVSIGREAKASQLGVSIGAYAGKNQDNNDRRNVYIGGQVAFQGSNATAQYNVGIGFSALQGVTSGSSNVVIGGINAGQSLTTGSSNSMIGNATGQQLTTGTYNTYFGFESGQYNVTGSRNTFVGGICNFSTSKSDSTCIGFRIYNSHNGTVILGSSSSDGVTIPSIADDVAQFHFRSANQSLFFNKNTNVVLKSDSALTSGTHFEAAAKNVITIHNGTAPAANITDASVMYSADITAGNAAPHFRTENGAIVKIYQETTGVAAATLVGGGGTTLTDTDTFDGYTMKQVVKALRNLGILA